MSIKFLVLGGGVFWVWGGGGECRFYFYGRADFSDISIPLRFRKSASALGKRAPTVQKKNEASKKCWFLGHAQTEQNAVRMSVLRADNVILERAFFFCWLRFSQGRGGSEILVRGSFVFFCLGCLSPSLAGCLVRIAI